MAKKSESKPTKGKATTRRTTTTPASQQASGVPAPITHLYVLLDRSGSMASIADDVIGGFNRLLADQQADGSDARITLVQFDGQDPQEVVADAVPITEMSLLDHNTFVPRGTTPLLDATGRILARARQRAKALDAAGEPAERIVVVSITDGHENASRELNLATVRRMIADRKADGWTFVFLSAAEDVYAEAGGLGYDTGSSQAFDASSAGVALAFSALSQATSNMRRANRNAERFDSAEFFAGEKPAEAHRRGVESGE